MHERKSQRLLPKKLFYQRLPGHILIAMGILFFSLLVGITGFGWIVRASWIDALQAMLLSGMGPVLQEYPTVGSKILSSFYALFSVIVLIANIGVAP